LSPKSPTMSNSLYVCETGARGGRGLPTKEMQQAKEKVRILGGEKQKSCGTNKRREALVLNKLDVKSFTIGRKGKGAEEAVGSIRSNS